MIRKSTLNLLSAVMLMLITPIAYGQRSEMQFFRYYDKRGVNVFETTKTDTIAFDGVKLRIGANFAQTYQDLSHSNTAKGILSYTDATNTTYKGIETAEGSESFNFINTKTGAPVEVTDFGQDPNVYGGYIGKIDGKTALFTNSNQVYEMSGGFPLAQANFNIDVQLADGVRVSLVSYMSSHHHNEFWVKGGYFQIDKVGFLNSEFMDRLWKNLTLKIGHMEINYGDAHFRRTDGGNALWNPFVENNLMDAFNTEIGGELYWQKNGIITMVGVTDGEIQGSVTKPNDRAPAFYGKIGFDKTFSENLRARLTGSVYTKNSSISNNLYSGDRTGSNYQFVLENSAATLTGNYRSGRINPGLTDNVTAFMINPFVKFNGLELFGTFEIAEGNSAVENGEVQYSDTSKERIGSLSDRKFTQYAVDVLYRFGRNEQFYIGGKYNTADGTLSFGQSNTQNMISQGVREDVTIERKAIGAGWYITKNILFKGEYVVQDYRGYPSENIMAGGQFEGVVIQGVIGF